jgi:hypothetical protein
MCTCVDTNTVHVYEKLNRYMKTTQLHRKQAAMPPPNLFSTVACFLLYVSVTLVSPDASQPPLIFQVLQEIVVFVSRAIFFSQYLETISSIAYLANAQIWQETHRVFF